MTKNLGERFDAAAGNRIAQGLAGIHDQIEHERASDALVIEAMERYGGGFVKKLAAAAAFADHRNLLRLKQAFPEYWAEYSKFALSALKKAEPKAEQINTNDDEK